VSRVLPPPLRLLRLANPVVRGVLDSRAHRLLSGRLLVLEYRGRRSGRTFRIPLRYAETRDGSLVAIAVEPDRKHWWRSFGTSGLATLTLRGGSVEAHGTVAEGRAREAALDAYVARWPRSAALAAGAAIVVFAPRSG
jgi:hypothetical protein